MKCFTTLLSSFFFFVALVSALPVLQTRDVFVPPVLYPHAGTVWYIGQTHNVTWDTTNHPVNITNTKGRIVLAKSGIMLSSGPGSLNDPLAANFSILLGRFEVKVPDVAADNDYAIVLFGDSGNFSHNFTIKA